MTELSQIETESVLSVPRYAPRKQPTIIPTARWDEEPLFCLKINDEWVSHLIGVLIALDQPDTWLGTDEEIYDARQQVNLIIAALMEACGMTDFCCIPPLIQMNEDGSISVSYDGGVTYTPATTEDPRKAGTQLPPLPDLGTGHENKCRAANDVTRQLKDLQAQWAAQLGGGLTILQLALAFAGAVIVLFLTAGTAAAVLVPALLTLAAAVVGTGETAYNDLFTSDVWDHVLCTFYCHCQEDGSYTVGDFNAISADFDSFFTGTLALAFSSALRAWQVEGLNQASKIPSTDNLSCDECGCDLGCGTEWSIFGDEPTHFHGEILDAGEDYVTVKSGTSGHHYILIRTVDNTVGCVVTEIETISGTFTNFGGSYVGETITEGSPNHYPADIVAGANCMAYIQIDSSGIDDDYVVKIHFTACP